MSQSRRSFIRNASLLGAGALLFNNRSFASLFSFPEYKLRELRGGVGIFTERGGTIGYFISKDGMLAIDSQFPDTSPHLIEELKKASTSPIRYLLNTHHHGDHSSGNIAWKGIVEHVMAHANSKINQEAAATKGNTLEKQLLPDLTYTDEMKIKVGGEKIKALYFGPGHTNGDSVYHFEEANIMHMGDLMFNKRHPFIDRSTGASIENWIKVLEKTAKKGNKDTIYIFGHSLNPGEETGSVDRLHAFKNYLTQLLDFTRAEVAKGVTKEDFLKNKTIPGNTEWTGQGLERPLTAAWEEVTAKK